MPAMGRGGLERFAWKSELELGLIANDRHLFLQTDFNIAMFASTNARSRSCSV